MEHTIMEYDAVTAKCRELFINKLKDYGPSWRVFRSEGITDQLFIKVSRIRTLENKGFSLIADGVVPEYVGLVNYCLIGLIQLELGSANDKDLDVECALKDYDKHLNAAKALMINKNHDYGEAWREMRLKGLTDLIMVKVLRIKQMEASVSENLVSEGIDANLFDILNYAVFALIKLEY